MPCTVMFDRGTRRAEVLDMKNRTRDEVVRSFISLKISTGKMFVECKLEEKQSNSQRQNPKQEKKKGERRTKKTKGGR